MKPFFSFFSISILLAGLLLSACGPAPNPKLVEKSAAVQEQASAAPTPAPEPAPVAEPPASVTAKPKRESAAKSVAVQPASTTRSGSAARPAPAPAPVRETETASTADSRTLTLPTPVSTPIAAPVPPPPDEVRPQRVEPPAPRKIRIPSGTLVGVRMIDPVDSETARVGETFKASLDAPIVVDDETVFPEGSEVWVKLSKVQSAGRVSGKSEIQLELDKIYLGRQSYVLESSKYVSTGAGQGGRTAKSAGLGAAIGAAIGAISGGGKGAVIGGATGAGAGAGVEAIRKGEQVRVDSETRLDFRLEETLEVTLQSPSSSSPQRNNPSGPPRFGTRQ